MTLSSYDGVHRPCDGRADDVVGDDTFGDILGDGVEAVGKSGKRQAEKARSDNGRVRCILKFESDHVILRRFYTQTDL